jgi:hypothetical protein
MKIRRWRILYIHLARRRWGMKNSIASYIDSLKDEALTNFLLEVKSGEIWKI